jgi:DNA polymerase III delta subunit
MIIFVTGNDSYLAAAAIAQIKQKYLQKNDGAELIEIDEATPEPNWADLQAVPLFATSRLVVIRRLGLFPAATLKTLPRILAEAPPSTVVVVWDGKPITEPELVKTLQGAAKVIPAATLVGRARSAWLQRRAKELEVELSQEDAQSLANASIADLWWLETELQSRVGGQVTGGAAKNTTGEPFAFFNLIRRRDWSGVKKELARKVQLGEPIELTIGSLAAAARKELKGSEAVDVLTTLLDIDLGLKTGFLEGGSAVALMSAHLPVPAPNRVQWEQAWEEMAL